MLKEAVGHYAERLAFGRIARSCVRATLDEMVEATGWLPHTTRAARTGLRHNGHTITKDKNAEGETVYGMEQEGERRGSGSRSRKPRRDPALERGGALKRLARRSSQPFTPRSIARHQVCDERRALADLQFRENAADMLANRVLADAELVADNLVAFSRRDKMGDLQFAACEQP